MGAGKQKNVLVPFLIVGWEKSCTGDKDRVMNILQIFQHVQFLTAVLGSQCKLLIKD